MPFGDDNSDDRTSSRLSRPKDHHMKSKHFRILIIGAGSGGISIAARLNNLLPKGTVAIIEPSDTHYYQPLWTLVGAGIVDKEQTKKPMRDLIPKETEWIKDSVQSINPDEKRVICSKGQEITFDCLVVATGLKLDWHKIKGLEGSVGKNGVCSIYDYEQAETTARMIEGFKGGNAIFTMPPVPIKCAGAPQKIMYLADEIFRENNVRDKSSVIFTTAGKVIFGVAPFASALMKVAERKSIKLNFSHKLIEVKPDERVAVFERVHEDLSNGQLKSRTELITLPYELLHVVPPMSAHDFIQKSGLAYTDGPHAGWLNVDQATLQHQEFKYIFGIGDVTGIPNSKTGAAIRKQAPVVVKNLLSYMTKRSLTAVYDGYSSCPLITGKGKVILAEFGYNGKLLPSFPLDMTVERRSMWMLKKDLLPILYWHGMMRGRM